MNTFHVPPRLPQTVIVVFAAAQFLAGLDMSIMNVALPAIQQEFDAGMMAVQWSVIAYMIAGAALALPAGDAKGPAVVLLHEWWGLNAHVRSLLARLAA